MKSSLKNSASKILTSNPMTSNVNNIRSNDYKLMPAPTVNLNSTLKHKREHSDSIYKLGINKTNFRSNEQQNRDRLASYDRKSGKFK